MISVLMPVYRTPMVFLERAILSVLGQTYGNWELLVVDDFSQDDDVRAVLTYYSALDSRVKYSVSPKNLGIAAATNLLLDRSNGEYIALLDHDDMLTRDALEAVVDEVSAESDVDLIYSGECKIDADDVVGDLFTKPDWSPSLLLNCMYTGHLSVYKTTTAKKAGGFDSRYDFSQDYDLALRVAELSPRVRHIEKVLYGWRMIPGSAAAGDKPTARKSNIAALQAAVDRRGLNGTAVALPTANRVKREVSLKREAVSIVVPSDNTHHIRETISSIIQNTAYPTYEIVVVTNSVIVAELQETTFAVPVKFVVFDDAYNFSAKCNTGALACSGRYIVFFNDDVRAVSPDWIESILEYLTMPDVGIVGPKLLYENGRVQHAGMVTGVRRLVGTAFHSYPSNSTAHYNFLQSVREVSLICGACLAISKKVFEQVGGFDAVNAGIAHSDVDLCFKVRQAGYTCVYTPYAEMIHIGHLSIGGMEKRAFKKDKADIYLMRRWGEYCARDPYFPKSMRDLLYIDSQEPFTYFPAHGNYEVESRDILIFSHDLSASGAPRIVLDMVRVLIAQGAFVLVVSPEDGPVRDEIIVAGGHVIIDPLALSGNVNITDLGKNFDIIIANTAICWPVVQQFSSFTRVVLYVHETELVEQLHRRQPKFRRALELSDSVLTGSALATAHLRRAGYTGSVTEVAYGVEEFPRNISQSPEKGVITISVLATIEPRKGQDLVIAAYRLLPDDVQDKTILRISGRCNDLKFYTLLKDLSDGNPGVYFEGSLDYDTYRRRLSDSDIIVCASRDDTLPLVSLDALAAGKILICSNQTGTAAYIENNVSGLVLRENTPECIRDALLEALVALTSQGFMGRNAIRVFRENFGTDAFKARFLKAVHY
ncbi:glycosyltransferase [Ensifer sp. MJa1]|uniref:glycosyltransferase n=1 Tax=Ensifer sp. MJa1 TaxID=2919888 RepID=UPI00300B1601